MGRPRVRARDGGEIALPSWEAAMAEDRLGKWALNLVPINVSTRKFGRAVRLPGGDVPAPNGAGLSKSAASRRFVALSAERMKEWLTSELSKLDLLVIQIDGIHIRGRPGAAGGPPPSALMAPATSIPSALGTVDGPSSHQADEGDVLLCHYRS